MKLVNIASRILNYIAAVFIGLMMLVTTADVLLRYLANRPIMGGVEIVELMMVLIVFPALAWCALSDGHVKVDLVMQRFPGRVQSVVDIITYIAGLSVCIIILWRAVSESLYIQQLDMTTSLLNIPIFPFYWIIAIGYILLSIVIVIKIIQKIPETCRQ